MYMIPLSPCEITIQGHFRKSVHIKLEHSEQKKRM